MLKILTVTGASTVEEPAESEGQHYTGDWHQWSSQHKPCSKGNFDVIWAPVKKKKWVLESPWSDPTPCTTNSHINLTTPSSCFHLENESLHPQSGAGLTPSTLGLQRSLWEDVNSAPSLLQKRVTQDLLNPWSRAWSTGSVREAEVKSYRTGAETTLRIKAESPEHRRPPLPPTLVGWRWGWVGGVHLPCRYQPWPFCGYSQGVVLRLFLFLLFFKILCYYS